MLVAEYDYDTDIAVQRAEAGRIAFAEGMSKGISQGIERGIEQGAYQNKLFLPHLFFLFHPKTSAAFLFHRYLPL